MLLVLDLVLVAVAGLDMDLVPGPVQGAIANLSQTIEKRTHVFRSFMNVEPSSLFNRNQFLHSNTVRAKRTDNKIK